MARIAGGTSLSRNQCRKSIVNQGSGSSFAAGGRSSCGGAGLYG